jgi:hypothetical protein
MITGIDFHLHDLNTNENSSVQISTVAKFLVPDWAGLALKNPPKKTLPKKPKKKPPKKTH